MLPPAHSQARSTLRKWPWYSGDEDEDEEDEEDEEEIEEEKRNTGLRLPRSNRYRFSRTSLSGRFIGLSRRRLGRGGR